MNARILEEPPASTRGWGAIGLSTLLFLGPPGVPKAAELPDKPAVSIRHGEELVLRGRVVCLAEEMHRLHATELPTDHTHLYGFRAVSGQYFTLLRTRFSEALFSDPRVRERELVLKARRMPKSSVLDVSRYFGVRDAKLEEIYYFCGICIIRGPTPGPCPCCQDDYELKVELTHESIPVLRSEEADAENSRKGVLRALP